jgi:hypothetical protein
MPKAKKPFSTVTVPDGFFAVDEPLEHAVNDPDKPL